jgi:[acyl-carrier-protein] S-malonyltransferase
VISNVTAEPHAADAAGIRARLVEQMVRPVLWSGSIARLLRDGFRRFAEVGPGKVLTGLMKDIERDTVVMNVQDADGVAKLRDLRAAAVAQ